MNELTEKKTPEQLGAEIRMYVDAGRRISLLCGIEIGKRLVQAKELLAHGEWLPWLEKETEFSDRSAARYMKLFEEYGASQLGLFGPETNSPTLANLPISKAFALLSVPENDRVEFAEEVDAEHISVRELEEKIKERDAKLETAEKEKAEAEDLLKTQDGMLTEAKEKVAELTKQIRELESRPVEVAVQTVRDEDAIAAAVKEARAKAEQEASKQTAKLEQDHEKTLKELTAKLTAAQEELKQEKRKAETAGHGTEQLRAELEEARKQLKTSDADVAVFKIRFAAVQTDFTALMEELKKVTARDGATGEKLHTAASALVETMRKTLETA